MNPNRTAVFTQYSYCLSCHVIPTPPAAGRSVFRDTSRLFNRSKRVVTSVTMYESTVRMSILFALWARAVGYRMVIAREMADQNASPNGVGFAVRSVAV